VLTESKYEPTLLCPLETVATAVSACAMAARSRLTRLSSHLGGATGSSGGPAGPAAAVAASADSGARLASKVAIVTGGGTGIGEAIVKALHGEGCTVWAVGRRLEPLQGLVSACPGVQARSVDVADEAAVGALFEEVGRCDILINNAGVNIVEREFRRLTPAAFKQVLDINTVGAFNCMHHAVEGAGGMCGLPATTLTA
jgi:hypothetical protein